MDQTTGDHYPLAFWSTKLAPRQMQWSPREQETYAKICALKNVNRGLAPIESRS